jgi:hypothetical protein
MARAATPIIVHCPGESDRQIAVVVEYRFDSPMMLAEFVGSVKPIGDRLIDFAKSKMDVIQLPGFLPLILARPDGARAIGQIHFENCKGRSVNYPAIEDPCSTLRYLGHCRPPNPSRAGRLLEAIYDDKGQSDQHAHPGGCSQLLRASAIKIVHGSANECATRRGLVVARRSPSRGKS